MTKKSQLSASTLKIKLEKSLEVFAIGIFLSTLLLFITVVLNINIWIYCFLPSLFLFSLIGAFIVMKSLVSFTRLKGEPTIPSDFEEKFAGSGGMTNTFWVIVIIIAILIYLFCYISNVNLFNFKFNVGTSIGLIFYIIAMIWGLYNIISQLSFVIFFISIIPIMFQTIDTEKSFYKKIHDIGNNKYDTNKNLDKLARKYNERILWLEEHMTTEKETEYKAKIYIYETCLRDIADILNQLDV